MVIIIAIIALYALSIVLAVSIARAGGKKAPKPPKEKSFRLEGLNYRIYPLKLIEKGLPSLANTNLRWELFTETSPTDAWIKLNLISLDSDKVQNVAAKSIKYRYGSSTWSSLNGCSDSYIESNVQTRLVDPILTEANRAVGKIAPSLPNTIDNYSILG